MAMFVFLLIVVLSVCVRKDIWFCDEVYTYQSANAGAAFKYVFLNSEWISGKDIITIFSANEFKLNFREIAENLYKDHLPLYFWLFRIASLIAQGSISKWIGLAINLLLLIPLYQAAVYLIHEFSGASYTLSGIAATAFLLHPLSLSEITTIRMYLMFSLIQVLFIIAIFRNEHGLKDYIKIGILAASGLLTHYHLWVWLGLFSVFYLMMILLTEHSSKIKKCGWYCITMGGVLGVTTILFPWWFKNLFLQKEQKGYRSFSSLFLDWSFDKDVMNTTKKITKMLAGSIDSIVICLVFLALMIGFILLLKREKRYIVFVVLLSCVFYSIIVVHSQPSKENRYLWSSSLMLYLLSLAAFITDLNYLFTRKATSSTLKSAFPIFLICLAGLNIWNSVKDDYACLTNYVRFRTIEDHNAILREEKNPWLVFSEDEGWRFYCSVYDFSIPDHVRRVKKEEDPKEDTILENALDVVVYTQDSNRDIDSCIAYIEKCAGRKASGYEKISRSYSMSVYKVHFNTREDKT